MARLWRRWRCHEQYVDGFKPKPDEPLPKSAEGGLVGQFGAEGGRVRAGGDHAVVEVCAQRSVCLASESDLVYVRPHWDYASQFVADSGCQRPWRRGLRRHPIPGDPGRSGRCRSAICTAELPRPVPLDELRRGALVGLMQPAG